MIFFHLPLQHVNIKLCYDFIPNLINQQGKLTNKLLKRVSDNLVNSRINNSLLYIWTCISDKYQRKVMGNHQIDKEKASTTPNIIEYPQHSIEIDDLCTLAEEGQHEEGINIQFIKKSTFKHSSNVLASKNIMTVDRQSSEICSSQTKKIPFNAPIQGLSQELISVLANKFTKPVKPSLSFPPVRIDFKNFIATKPAPIQHQYNILQKIGFGGFGVVYKAQFKAEPGQFRAIKKIDKKKLKQSDASQLNNEFQILKKCDHPNIIKIYDSYQDQDYFFVVSELCQGGNLLDYYNNNRIQQDQAKIIMVEILCTLKYLHNLRILHRDIKLQNILIIKNTTKQKKIQIKLIDFGLSLILTHNNMRIDEMSGTLLYMPPESLYGELTLKSDIWSCGIILYMLVTKHMPFKFTNSEDLMEKIEYCRIIRKHLNKINVHAKILINLMLQRDTSKRITADRALRSEWLRNTKAIEISTSQKKRAATQILAYEPKNNLISMIESFIAFKKVNQLQRQRLAALFAQFDKDKSGVIDIREFKAFCLQNCEVYDESQMEKLLKVIDKNQSGCIDFTEFIIAMHNEREKFHFKYLKEIFQFFDSNRSGDIQKSQIRTALKGIKNEELDQLFAELDVNSNQKISEIQFVRYFKTNQF